MFISSKSRCIDGVSQTERVPNQICTCHIFGSVQMPCTNNIVTFNHGPRCLNLAHRKKRRPWNMGLPSPIHGTWDSSHRPSVEDGTPRIGCPGNTGLPLSSIRGTLDSSQRQSTRDSSQRESVEQGTPPIVHPRNMALFLSPKRNMSSTSHDP